ncbi:MAG: glycosyltransferase family 39 protein [Candidatus Levybacteria bacterium]|nr:glycosyltransferase family 39 protein [Candidatus Levybacteria bacterium]
MFNKKNLYILLRSDMFLMLALFIAAIFMRLYVLASLYPFRLSSDDAIYMSMARYIKEGQFSMALHPVWLPLFPFISAVFNFIIKDWALTGRMVSVVFGSLLVIPIYVIARSAAGRKAGLLACIFLIFFYPLLYVSSQSLSEALLAFLVWCGLALSLKNFKKNKMIYSLSIGLLWGLAALTKSEGFFVTIGFGIFSLLNVICRFLLKINHKNFLFPILCIALGIIITKTIAIYAIVSLVLAAYLLLGISFLKNIDVKKHIIFRNFLFISIGFLLIYLPYNIALTAKYNKQLFFAKSIAFKSYSGYFQMNAKKTSTWIQDVDSLETYSINPQFSISLNEIVTKIPTLLRTGIYDNFTTLGKKIFSYNSTLELILFFTGFYWYATSKKNYFNFFLISLILFLAFTIMTFFTSSLDLRYISWFIPIIPLGMSFGIIYLESILRNRKYRVFYLLLVFLLVIQYVLNNISVIWPSQKNINIANILELKLPSWQSPRIIYRNLYRNKYVNDFDIKLTILLKNKRVMARHEGFLFESKSLLIYSPDVLNLDELLTYAKKWKVDYIVGSQGEVADVLNFLYLQPKDYPGLKLMFFQNGLPPVYKLL